MSIDTEVFGDPASCRSAATQVDDVKAALETLDSALASARSRTIGAWEGGAAAAFLMDLGNTTNATDDISGKLGDVSTALMTFAGTLAAVKSAMADARSTASAGGCVISGWTIQRPDDLEGEVSPTVADAHDRKVLAYNRAFTIAEGARDDETRAHSTLQDALDGATGPGFLEGLAQDFGIWPKGDGAGWDVAAMVGGGFLGFGSMSTWATMFKYGRFAPTWGPFSSVLRWTPMALDQWASSSRWSKALLNLHPDNIVPKPGMSGAYGGWSTAGRWIGRAGGVLEGGLSAYEQWQADADNPAFNESERGARAGTVGVTTGVGAWGGAVAGAQVGAAIGSVFPGPGTAIGGIIGGAVGGLAGSKLGGAVGDWVKDEVGAAAGWAQDQAVAGWNATTDAAGEAWDATSEAAGEAWDSASDAAGDAWDSASDTAGDVVDGAGDMLDDAGEKLSDVGDKLSFWD